MAKAPIAGAVKTRLCPPFDAGEAAELAAAFAIDTWAAACSVAGATAVLARAGERVAYPRVLANANGFDQRGDDLGARIEHAVRGGLAIAPRAIAIGSDIPGVPIAHLEAARDALARADAVLGPSGDGGYYLIGMTRCETGLLADLPWSRPDTRAATRARLEQRGYTVHEIDPYDDVDDIADVRGLWRALEAREVSAAATAAVLSRLSWT